MITSAYRKPSGLSSRSPRVVGPAFQNGQCRDANRGRITVFSDLQFFNVRVVAMRGCRLHAQYTTPPAFPTVAIGVPFSIVHENIVHENEVLTGMRCLSDSGLT